MQKLLIIAFVLIQPVYHGLGQDIHFSQFYNSPISLNPANAGNFDGNIRVVVNNRNQWASVTDPFVSSAISVDTKNWEDRLKGDAVGVGLLLLHDKSGGGTLTYLAVMVDASYYKELGKQKSQYLIGGIQGGFFQKSLDESNLTFESQFRDTDFSDDIYHGENFTDFTVLQPDFQAGLGYGYKKPKGYQINTGLSFFHLTRPNQSFLQEVDKLSLRSTFYADARFILSSRAAFVPAFLLMHQNAARQMNLGGAVEYTMESEAENNVILHLGSWYRGSGSDALIIMTGVEYKRWHFGFSYDINTSSLQTVSNSKGAFEVSIIYISKYLSGKKNLPWVVPCLRLY